MTSISYLSRIVAMVLAALGLIVFGFLQHVNSLNSYAVEPSDQSSLEQQGLAFINARCTICHSSDLITQQQLDRSMWTKEVDKMIKWGAPVRPEERKFLLDYLSTCYGPQRSMGSSSAETERQLGHISDPPIYTGPGPKLRSWVAPTLWFAKRTARGGIMETAVRPVQKEKHP